MYMNTYICKDCHYNHNGWCTERKCQGLKKIMDCNSYMPSTKESTPIADTTVSNDTLERRELYGEAMKVLGSVYALVPLLRVSKLYPNDSEAIMLQLEGQAKSLVISAKIHGLEKALTSVIDEDMYNEFLSLIGDAPITQECPF